MFNRSQYDQFLSAVKKDKLEKTLVLLPLAAAFTPIESLKTAVSKKMPAGWGNPKLTLGEAALGAALQSGSFHAARFLVEILKVEIGALEMNWQALKEKFASQPRFIKFTEMLAAGEELPAFYNEKNKDRYFNRRIKNALAHDDVDELQYLAQVNTNFLLDYLENSSFQDIFQQAAVLGSLRCLQYLLCVLPDYRYKSDMDGNSLVQLAVRAGQKEVVEYLSDDALYDLGGDLNRRGESVFDTARKYGHEKILSCLHRLHDPKTLDLMPTGLHLSSFIEGDDLSVKGLALMLHYFAKKNQYEQPVFLVQEDRDKVGVKIAKFLDLFARSSNKNLLLYSNDGVHRYVYKCEKFQGKIYVLVLDSITEWTDKLSVIEEMRKDYSESLAKINFCMTETRQQTAFTGCHYYALKNASLCMKTANLYQELEEGDFFTTQERVGDVPVRQFILPARFMHLTTSPAKLKEYISAHPEEGKKIVRKTKDGIQQNLMEYSLHGRDRFGLKTPEHVLNIDFDLEDENCEEDLFISKNNSLWYFQNKYLKYSIPMLIHNHSQAELARILTYHDAKNMVLDQDNKITNKTIIRLTSQWGKNNFVFLPRSSQSASSKPIATVSSSQALNPARLFTQVSLERRAEVDNKALKSGFVNI